MKKQTYAKPSLKKYGSVAVLTLAVGMVGAIDNNRGTTKTR